MAKKKDQLKALDEAYKKFTVDVAKAKQKYNQKIDAILKKIDAIKIKQIKKNIKS
ncbi:MAG TPA: hypothetical protein VJB67_02040 [Patescibacteria group bacterium]|nr:hypothetical protein [Patescibacteria group bacterium]